MRFRGAQRIRLTALSFLLFALLITGVSVGARHSLSNDPTALTRRLRSLDREKERTLSHLRHLKQRQRRVNRELQEIGESLGQTETRLHEVKQDVQEAQLSLAQAVRESRAAEARLDGHREDVSERLVAVYELGEVRPVEVLLQSTSFTDLANRVYLLDQMVERDAELLDDYEQAQAAAEQHRANVVSEERRVTELQREWEAERSRVSQWRDATAEKRDRLLADRAEYERALAELEQNSNEVRAMLERYSRTRVGRARLAQPWRGGLRRPVEGRVTSGFGYRTHPIFRVRKMHTGVDIPAPTGTPIHAAAGGIVVFAGRWGGYGNCVILDHGGGLATLYGHCSSLSVGEGQSVEQGQTIARVGSTGLATGPHLHFETRRDGQPVNPLGF